MGSQKQQFFEQNKDYGWTSSNDLLTAVHGTRLDHWMILDPVKTILATPPWNAEPMPERAKAIIEKLVPDINSQEFFLFHNAWQRYLEQKNDALQWPPARATGGDILAIHNAASALLEAIDNADQHSILILADRYHRLKDHSPAPYMSAHITQELCRLITAICEDRFMFEFAKAARDKKRGPTPMTRSEEDREFVEGVVFWLESLLQRLPTYSELQQLIDAFCGKQDALKQHVQRITTRKQQENS